MTERHWPPGVASPPWSRTSRLIPRISPSVEMCSASHGVKSSIRRSAPAGRGASPTARRLIFRAFAQYVKIPASSAVPIPESIDLVQAVGVENLQPEPARPRRSCRVSQSFSDSTDALITPGQSEIIDSRDIVCVSHARILAKPLQRCRRGIFSGVGAEAGAEQ